MLERYQMYLESTVIPVRLACVNASGWPVVLSLWYLYRQGMLYCATQSGAKVIDYLHNDPRCGFEISSDLPPYCGIRGRAEATLIPKRGDEILVCLLDRYLGGTSSELAQNLLRKRETEVAIQLQPISVYGWNFSDRMRDTNNAALIKPCP